MHKRNCAQISTHVKLIGSLLESLKSSDLSRYPATREPLEQLEEALGRATTAASSIYWPWAGASCTSSDRPRPRLIAISGSSPSFPSSMATASRSQELVANKAGIYEWQANLLNCCRDPCLCLKACFYPCGTFGSIASVATGGKISPEDTCSNLLAHTLMCGCCCYTCCVRRRQRRLFSIRGGSCDDFLSHLMCCCCALVQERKEIQLRGYEGFEGKKMKPPPIQEMTS